MRFDLLTLNLILAIAETRSITRGAEREHLALAAASKRLSDLETRLGVQLFERRARGVELTAAGQALVRHIRSLHASLHAMEDEVAEYSHGIRGHLRIVANASAIAECLPPDLAAFSRAHPEIRISLEDQTSAELQRSVAEGSADVGIFVPPLLEPARLQTWPYREGTLVLITPPGHVLAARAASGESGASVRFAELLDFDFIGQHTGAALQQMILAQATEQGRALRARMQVRGFDAIAQLVEAGLGIALMPSAVAQRLARLFDLALIALDEPWVRREYLIGVRAQDVLPAVVRRFVEFLGSAAPSAASAASASAISSIPFSAPGPQAASGAAVAPEHSFVQQGTPP